MIIVRCAMRKEITTKTIWQGTRHSISGIIFLLFLAFLIMGCGRTDSGKAQKPKEETSMGKTALKMERPPAIPPIDASAPARVETATFALG
jgi:hypothetical protein